MNQRRRLLTIVGYPRSGTTLLWAVLNQSPFISLANESELWLALRTAGYSVESVFPVQTRQHLIHELKRIGLTRLHLESLPGDILSDFPNCEQTLSFREVFEKLLPRTDCNKLLWGEKSLNNLSFAEDIKRLYPEAVFPHILRDPRAAGCDSSSFRRTLEEHQHFLDVSDWRRDYSSDSFHPLYRRA
jgi:hypothetical protein